MALIDETAPPLPVHWHEGLFLEPHHIQILQRQGLEQIQLERRRLMSYPYGVIRARIIEPDLVNHLKIRFDTLRVVMKSGVEVWFPENAELPEKDIASRFNERTEPFIVYLGVPRWLSQGANTLERDSQDDWRSARMYRIASIDCADENTGLNPRTVLVRKINARLLVEGEDATGLDVLPLLRIVPAASDDRRSIPRVDTRFVPATLLMTGSPALREMVLALINYLRPRRAELLESMSGLAQINDVEPVRGEVFKKILRLQIYNRYFARLQHLHAAPATTPEQMYLDLRMMLADLAALDARQTAELDAAPYDHDRPLLAFDEVCKKIRNLMPAQGATHEKVDLVRDQRFWLAQLTEKHFSRPSEYYLAVSSKQQDPKRVRELVQNASHFKLASRKDFASPLNYGLRLSWEYPPVVAPAHQQFFKINRLESGATWDRVREERTLAAWWQDWDTSDFQLALYMTFTTQEGES